MNYIFNFLKYVFFFCPADLYTKAFSSCPYIEHNLHLWHYSGENLRNCRRFLNSFARSVLDHKLNCRDNNNNSSSNDGDDGDTEVDDEDEIEVKWNNLIMIFNVMIVKMVTPNINKNNTHPPPPLKFLALNLAIANILLVIS